MFLYAHHYLCFINYWTVITGELVISNEAPSPCMNSLLYFLLCLNSIFFISSSDQECLIPTSGRTRDTVLRFVCRSVRYVLIFKQQAMADWKIITKQINKCKKNVPTINVLNKVKSEWLLLNAKWVICYHNYGENKLHSIISTLY